MCLGHERAWGRLFNAGANRYNAALQVGYQKRVLERVDWMVAVDGVVFGDNDDFLPGGLRLEQALLYTVQSGFAWRALPRVTLAAAWFHRRGGETEVDGVSRSDDIHLHRYQVSTVFDFAPPAGEGWAAGHETARLPAFRCLTRLTLPG